ncbi:hypothetical protein V1387_05065 [Allomuricauda taeanensis]|uniref:DUF7793 family protein n=1 Tax=Flagellimonas taeanensis TaxID=1005926 RepID=UPI002E7C5126|nr:hypothetical protein [Allomuricauda taeanensis]MEE1962047.1 hypothetical protein [Allomuricauda taeanensis]
MKNGIENDMASMWLEDEILFFSWKKDVELDLAKAKRIVRDRLRLQQGRAYPILCNQNGIRSVEKDAWCYLAGDGTELIKAIALVSLTPLEYALSKFFMKQVSSIPIQVFEELSEAKEFLLRNN